MFTCLYIKVVLGVVAACARALHTWAHRSPRVSVEALVRWRGEPLSESRRALEGNRPTHSLTHSLTHSQTHSLMISTGEII